MPNYVIPNVLHFVWFGKEISRCKGTLTAWRNLHANHIINLWTSIDTLSSESFEDLKKVCIKYKIKLRDIKEEISLDLHTLILQELNKGRYWTASDAARFSILNEEPGFYFDIGVIPKKPLPEKISCTQGFLLKVDVQDSVAYDGASINYNIFCSARKNHPFFKKVTFLINANFDFLNANPVIEKNFYAALNNEQNKLYPELTAKQQADYIFARIMTGSIAQTVLFQDYIYNISDDISVTNLKFFNLSFNYQSFLDIPPGKAFDSDNSLFQQLKNCIVRQIILNTAKTVNYPFTDKINSISKLKFFFLQDFDEGIHLLAMLTAKE